MNDHNRVLRGLFSSSTRGRQQRRTLRRRRLFFENLEPRIVLASTASLSSGDLLVTGGAEAVELTFSTSGTNLVVTDSTGITAGAGVTQVDFTTVHAPLDVITGTLVVTGSDSTADTVAFGESDLSVAGIRTRDVETVSVDADAMVTAAGGFDIEADNFTANGGATISTRSIASADPAEGDSTTDSGDILVYAHHIDIQAGSRLLAQVEDSSLFSPGKVSLRIDSSTVALPLIPQVSLTEISITIGGSGAETAIRGGEIEIEGAIKNDITSPKRVLGYTDQTVAISIENASLEGESVSVRAESEDKSLLEDLPEWVTANFIEPFGEFLVDELLPVTPISVMIRGAKATVTVVDSKVLSETDVTLQANTVVDASAEAVAAYAEILKVHWRLSAGYSQASSTAETTVGGDSRIQAGGKVEIGTDAETTAEVTARTTSNIPWQSPANPRDVVGSFAITNANTISRTTIEEGVSVTANGNVAVCASGTIENNATSGATTYGDGAGGVSVSLAFDNSDIQSKVDGRITAGGTDVTREVVLANVNGNRMTIPNHGFQDGQIVEYLARDPGNPNAPLNPIGGLLSGEQLRVMVVDQDTVQLARVAPLEIDSRGANPESTQTFSRRDTILFNPQTAVNPSTDTITLANHGFTTGQQLDYGVSSDQDEAIGGLVDQTAYFVIRIDASTFRLAATVEDATAGTSAAIDLTSHGTGTSHIFGYTEVGTGFSPVANFNGATDTFTITGHGFSTGDALVYATDPDIAEQTVLSRTAVFDPTDQINPFNPIGTVDLDQWVVNLSTDTLALVNHGLSTGDQVTYHTQDGFAIGGLDDGADYFVIKVDERFIQLAETAGGAAMDLEAGATLVNGPHELTTVAVPRTISFDPTGTVLEPVLNTVSDTVLITPFHNYAVGQRLRYQTGGGAPIGGLSDSGDYFAIPVDDVAVRLAVSRENALAGVAIDLTNGATGSGHQFTANDVDTIANLIVSPAHEIETGEKLTYRKGDGNTIAGLNDGAEYFAIRLDDHTIRLANTLSDASTGVSIDLLSTGSGTMQGLERSTFVSTFDPTRTMPVVDLTLDTIELPAHGLDTGDAVNYQASGGDPIGGLDDSTDYFAICIDADHIQLAATAAGATAGTAIGLHAGATLGTGLHVFRIIPEVEIAEFPDRLIAFDPTLVPALDTAANTIRLPNHGLSSEESLSYLSGSGLPIGGLTNGAEYFVIVVNDDAIQLAASAGGTALDLSGGATGDRHGLQRASTITKGDPALRGLTNAEVYFAIVHDANTFQLAKSSQDALAAAPIGFDPGAASGTVHSLEATDETDGVLVAADLKEADNRAIAGAGIGGSPTLGDLLTKPELQTSLANEKIPALHHLVEKLAEKFHVRSPFHAGKNPNIHGSGTTTNNLLSAAAGISLNLFGHTVLAQIGSTADIDSGQNVVGRSSASQKAQVTAQGNIFMGSAKKFATGVAVALGFYANDVQTIVAGDGTAGASIDAAGAIEITSELEYPLLVEPLELLPFSSFYSGADEYNIIGDLSALLDGSFGLTRIMNVWSASSAYTTKAADLPKVSFSGSLGYTAYTNTSQAIVQGGAKLNQNTTAQNDEQKVNVQAATGMELVNVTGIMYLFMNESGLRDAYRDRDSTSIFTRGGNFFSFFGNKSSTFGMGGSAVIQFMNNTTTALIDDGAAVYSGVNGGLEVSSSQDIYSLEFAQSGGDSGSIGISASIVWVDQTSHTIAQLASGVQVTGGPVSVKADDQTTHTSIAGSAQLAKRLGIGVGFALLNADRTTLALVGKQRSKEDDSIGSAGTLIDVSALNLEAASTGDLWSFGLVGAVASNIPTGAPAQQHGQAGPVEATSGVALVGDAAVNTISDTTRAYINDDGTITSGDIALVADDETSISTVTGAGAIGAKPDGTIGGALAGSFSYNELNLTTEAFIVGPTIEAASDVTLDATSDGSILAVSAGLAGAFGKSGVTVAGSFSWNEIDNTVRAFVDRTVMAQLTNLELSADDTSTVQADGGAASIALSRAKQGFGGAVAFGVSAAINHLTPTVQAYITESTVTNAAGVALDANSTTEITAITWAGDVAGAASGSKGLELTGAGAGSGNSITATVEATIQSNSHVSTASGGDVRLTAVDTPHIEANAGGVAADVMLGGGTNVAVTIGAAAAFNIITGGSNGAQIVGSTVTSGGDVALEAQSDPLIWSQAISLSVGIAMSGGADAGIILDGAGAGSGNEIRNTTEAVITGDSLVTTSGAGDVTLTATDDSQIKADAPGISLSFDWVPANAYTLEVGIAITSNEIANTLQANVEGSTIVSAGGFAAQAESAATIDSLPLAAVPTLTMAQGNSISLSGVGAQAFNTISSDIEASVTGYSQVTAAGDIKITASDDSIINANVAAATLTVNISVGEEVTGNVAIDAALATNQLGQDSDRNSVRAFVEDSTVTTSGAIDVSATSMTDLSGLTVGIGLSLSASSGVSFALNGFGAETTNIVRSDVEAAVLGTSNVSTTGAGNITLSATEAGSPKIEGQATGGSLSGAGSGTSFSGALTVGVVLTENDVANRVLAHVDQAAVTSGGDVQLDASSTAEVDSLTVFVSLSIAIASTGSIAAAGDGANSTNTIKNTIEAYVLDSNSTITGSGSVLVNATDHSTVNAQAGGGNFTLGIASSFDASIAVAAVLATNDIKNTVQSYLDNSTVNAAADVRPTTTSQPKITATTVSVALSGSGTAEGLAAAGSVAASQSKNTISGTITAHITNSDVTAGGAVRVASNAILPSAGPNINATAPAVSVGVSGTDPFAGVAFALTAAGGSVTNESTSGIQAFIDGGSVVTAAGAVDVAASDTIKIDGDIIDVTVALSEIGVSIAAALVTNTYANDVQGYIEQATVSSTAGAISVTADSSPTATGTAVPVAVAVVASGAGANATSDINGSVTAFVAGQASLTASHGTVTVEATSTADTEANADGGGGALLTIGALLANASIGQTTKAYVSGGSSVHAAGLSVIADSVLADAEANVLVVNVGAISGNGGQANAEVTGDVIAFVGAESETPSPIVPTDIQLGNGGMTVQAKAESTTAHADGSGGAGGVVAVSVLEPSAIVTADTKAYVGQGASVAAGALIVDAAANLTSSGTAYLVNIGSFTGAGVTATADITDDSYIPDGSSDPDGSHTAAFITGSASGTTPVAKTSIVLSGGDASVTSTLTGKATTEITLGTGAIYANGGGTVVDSTMSGLVDAYLGDHVDVTTGGDVTVHSTSNSSAEATSLGVTAAGGIAAFGTKTTATLRPTLNAFSGSDVTIVAEDVSVLASHNVDGSGAPLTAKEARADGTAGSGALIGGGEGANVQGTVSPTIDTRLETGTSVHAAGTVTVASRSYQFADVIARSDGAAGVATVGVTLATGKSQGTINTHIDGHIASADSVVVQSVVTAEVDVTGEANGFALGVAGVGTNVQATVGDGDVNHPLVATYVSGSGQVTSTNNVDIQSLVTTSSVAKSSGYSVSAGASVGSLPATSTVQPVVRTRIDDGASVISTDGNVRAISGHNYDLQTGAFLGDQKALVSTDNTAGSAGISVGDTTINADANADVATILAAGATVNAIAGQIDVESRSSNLADAHLTNMVVGLLIDVDEGHAIGAAHGTTSAEVLGAIEDDSGGIGASSVTVIAQASDISSGRITQDGGGGIHVGKSNAQAKATPTVSATVAGTIRAASNINIDADSFTDADANIDNSSGGVIDVNDYSATVTVTPVVSATVADNAVLSAGNSLRVATNHGQPAAGLSDGTFNAATQVNPAADMISFTDDHGLQTGANVTYDALGNPLIGGLGDGRTYGAVVASEKSLQLGDTFVAQTPSASAPAGINILDDTIVFASPHNFEGDGGPGTSDRVIYTVPSGSTGVGGLQDGATYLVNVVDATTIRLVDPSDLPAAPLAFAGTSVGVDSQTITITGHGFVLGQTVAYAAPAPAVTSSFSIDVDVQTDTMGNPIGVTPDAAANNIYFGAAVMTEQGFQDGDIVIYTAGIDPSTNAPAPIGGLIDGGRYVVIFDAAEPNQIQLGEIPVPPAPATPIDLDPSGVTTNVTQTFRKVEDQPIGGLVDQHNYFVVPVTVDTFRLAPTLADAQAGTNLVTLNPLDSITGNVLTGTRNTLGTRGVDLTSVGAGRHHLVIDLTSASTGQQQLTGIGGAAGLAGAPSGDGIATASVSGGGGGAVSVDSAHTTATSKPTSTLTIGQAAALNAGSITLTASSAGNLGGSTDNNNGGFVAVSSGDSAVSADNHASVVVNDSATINASQDVTITSATSESASTLTDIGSSGFAGIPKATANATVDYQSKIDIHAATLTAGNLLTIAAQSNLSGDVTASADGSGVGSGSHANDSDDKGLFIGGTSALTQASILGGAQLSADTISLQATVTSVDARVEATALGAGLGGNSNADARLRMTDTTAVVLESHARLTGNNVNLSSTHNGIVVKSHSNSRCDCGGGADNSTAETNYNSYSRIDGQQSASIMTSNLTVSADQNVTTYDRNEDHGGGFLVFGSHNEDGSFNAHRDISWNSTVGLTHHADPQLVVDSNAVIITDNGVTVTTDTGVPLALGDAVPAGRTIVVGGIVNEAAGKVVFEANVPGNQDGKTPPSGTITGSQGVFELHRTFGSVGISNASSRDLQVNGLAVFSASDPSDTDITINVQTDYDHESASKRFSFDVNDIGPTTVTIENTHPTAAPRLIINGVIDNPIGSTTVTNASGDIVATGDQAVVRTNELTMTAASGNIGKTGGVIGDHRVNVQLVQSSGRPTALQSRAGIDNAMSIQGLLRDPAVADFRPNIDLVAAGDDVDLLLLQGRLQTTAGSGGVSVNVGETSRVAVFPTISVPPASAPSPPRVTAVVDHWPPSGSGPTPVVDLGLQGTGTATIDTTYDFAGTFGGQVRRLQAGGDVAFQGCAAGGCGTATSAVSVFGNVVLTSLTDGVIHGHTNGSIDLRAAVVETANRAMRVGVLESTTRSVTLTVPDSDAFGEDLILFDDSIVAPSGSRVNAATSVTLAVGDNLWMAGNVSALGVSSQIHAGTTVLIQGDQTAPDPDPGVGSVIDLRGLISANLSGTITDSNALLQVARIETGSDADIVSLTNVTSGTGTTIRTYGANDLVQVGSQATVAIGGNPPASWDPQNTGGVLNAIRALLTIQGGDQQDTLSIDDSGETNPSTGVLTSSTISGLFGAGGSISYGAFEFLNIGLGTGGDTFTVAGTHGGTTNLAAHAGADVVHVQSTQGELLVDTGGELLVNTVNVGSLAPLGGGVVDTIQGELTVVGNYHDTLNVDDTGSTVSKIGTLGPDTLTGLGLGASGIHFSGLAVLFIALGSGDDTLTISGDSGPYPADLTVDAGTGTDEITVAADLELGQVIDPVPSPGQLTLRADHIYLNASTISTFCAPTAGRVLLDGAVTLGADVWINTNGMEADGSIHVTGPIVAASHDLTLNAGSDGDLTLSGALSVGGILLVIDANVQSYQGLGVQQLDIRDATTSVTFFGTVTSASTVDVTSGGTIWLRQPMTAADAVVFLAGTDITFDAAGDLSSISGAVQVTADADHTGGAGAGAITMADGTVVSSGGGLIQLTASGNITLGSAVTAGEVQVTSLFSAIVDGGDTDPEIRAARAVLRAQAGIGDADDPRGKLETVKDIAAAALTLAAVTDRGDIQVRNTGALIIGTVDGLIGVTVQDTADANPGDDIVISSASPETINSPVVNNAGGDIIQAAEGDRAEDDLTINADITASGGAGNIFLYAGDSIEIQGSPAARTISAEGAGAILLSASTNYNNGAGLTNGYDGADAAVAGRIVMHSGSRIRSQDGDITLRGDGDVLLSFADANSDNDAAIGHLAVAADYAGVAGGMSDMAGAIRDNLSAETANLRGNLATLRAATGIGSGGGDADLETHLVTVDARNTTNGDIGINELAAGRDLTVRQARQDGAGSMSLSTENGDLFVQAAAHGGLGVQLANAGNTTGAIRLDANVADPATHEPSRGNVAIAHVVTAQGGPITIDADHDVTGTIYGVITNHGGNIAVTADTNNAGPLGGSDDGTIQLDGNLAAGAGAVTFSLADCDGWIGAAPGSTDGNVTAANIFLGVDANAPEGVLRLQGGANTFSGTTTVVEGTLIINGVLTDTVQGTPAGGDVVVQAGGVLGGHGDGTTTGVINGSVTVLNGGILDPGDYGNCTPQTGVLTVNVPLGENVDVQFGGTFRVQLGGLTAGATSGGYDQLALYGTATLNGDKAMGAGGGTLLVETQFAVPFGAEFILISNDLTELIETRFLGLPEGAFLYPGGVLMNISYLAGSDNNDVVLTGPGRFDFNGFNGYTAENYLPISPFQSKEGNAAGWLTLPPQWFERYYPVVPPYTSPEERLQYDGQATDTLGNPLTFQVDVPAGVQYEVMILTGDAAWNHDREQFQVYDGSLPAPPTPPDSTQVIDTWGGGAPEGGAIISYGGGTPNPSDVKGYYRWVRFTTEAIADTGDGLGKINVTLRDLGGADPATVILGLDIRPVDSEGKLTIAGTNPEGRFSALEADGDTVDTYSGSGAPPGAMLTVTVSAGLQYATILNDADTTMFGGQVVAQADGSFTFSVLRPATLAAATGTPPTEDWTILVEEASGLSRGTAIQPYQTPTVTPLRFDFGNYNSPVAVDSDFLQVEPRTTYNATRGYGWTTRVASKDRWDTTSGTDTATALRRDFNYALTGVFRVDLAAGTTYNVRLYHANPHNGTTPFVAGQFTVYSNTVLPHNAASSIPQYSVGTILPGDTVVEQFSVTTGTSGVLFLDFRSLGAFLVSGLEISDGALPDEVPLVADGNPRDAQAAAISLDMLQPVVTEAAARWAATGLTPAQAAALASAQVTVADLGGAYLGLADPATNAVRIDDDAARFGWSVVRGPWSRGSHWTTDDGQRVTGGVDLLRVVMHELGHLLGYEHSADEHDLMAPVLSARRSWAGSTAEVAPESLGLARLQTDLPSLALQPPFPIHHSSSRADAVFAESGRDELTAQGDGADASPWFESWHNSERLAAATVRPSEEATQARVPRRSRLQRFERELDAWFAELEEGEDRG
jgi:autotransporter-associated beta strand protein